MRNFVAKYSSLINKPKVEKDKKKTYSRKNKHKGDKNDKSESSSE
jgi:hypothetical protein